MAALASAGSSCVVPDQLAALLQKRKVGLKEQELEQALSLLVRWDLLRRDGCGYRYSIPLLQRWVAENRPLRRVKMELDNNGPVAEKLYDEAQQKYGTDEWVQAEQLLRRTLAVNPRHVGGHILLGRVHLKKGNPAEAVAAMEAAYATDPAAAQDGLLAALLANMETQRDVDEQWQTVNRILRLKPNLPAARAKRDAILRSWANEAAEGENYKAALNAYDQLDNKTGTMGTRTRLHLHSLSKRLLSRPGSSK
jgi:tetratricopeptide (TPR) repeat protein